MLEAAKDAKKVACMLLQATLLPDGQVFRDLDAPRYTTVDYYRMACHMLFVCQRCGMCCTTGDPIRLRQEDAATLARHLKIPLNKALKKYTVPDPNKPEALDFKHILPCKFYDPAGKGCKIYAARPWSCRIFPFLGIYGSEDQVKVNESCAGSLGTIKILKEAIEEARKDARMLESVDPEEVRKAKEWLRRALDSV
jgi:Fe-S-cluster containining protein